VQEITVSGDVVFSASELPYFDDFDTNTLSDYEIYKGTAIDDSDFSIASSELRQANTNGFYFIGYDVTSENLSAFFVETVVTKYADNDHVGASAVFGGNEIAGGEINSQNNECYISVLSFPNSEYKHINGTSPVSSSMSGFSFGVPFTQRLEYDGNDLKMFHNGTLVATRNYTASGPISLIGLTSNQNDPGIHWDSIEIGSL